MKELLFLRERPIAHRGLWNMEKEIPENSIPSFEKAIEKKFPIEIDVHLLEDGKVVVFHDDDLNRMTGVKKKIKDCTYEEIEKLRLKGTQYKIPLLSDVLDLVDGRVPLLIELKHDRKVGETEAALMEVLKGYRGMYAVQNFSPRSIMWFKKNYPDVPRGQLASNFSKERMPKIEKLFLKNLYLNFLAKPDFIAYAIHDFPNKRVEHFRRTGKLVLGWTVRTNEDFEEAKGNCDNVIGENFEKLDMSIFYSNNK